MSASSGPCLRCGGVIEAGYTVDVTHGSQDLPKWYPGEARRSFWGGLKIDKASARTVFSMRCRRADGWKASQN